MKKARRIDPAELHSGYQNEQPKSESKSGFSKHMLESIVDTMLRTSLRSLKQMKAGVSLKSGR